jgi:tetratricopeptide (TPR) repeat protein
MNAAIYYLGGHNPKDAAGARQAYERALAIDPQLPEALLARANYATFVALDPDQALPDLEAVVRSRPSSADAHEMLGYALRRLGRMEAALEHFSRAWDLDPLNVEYSWEPFFTLLGLRRWPEAIAQADLQIKRFPGDAERRMARARFESLARSAASSMRSSAALSNPRSPSPKGAIAMPSRWWTRDCRGLVPSSGRHMSACSTTPQATSAARATPSAPP